MAVASAPGRVCLLGEHAVVYGEPALACAISLRTRVEAREARETSIRPAEAARSPYVREALALLREESRPATQPRSPSATRAPGAEKPFPGLRLRIASDVPPGRGLASSAALSVALLGAARAALGRATAPRTVAPLAREVERRVQGRASPMDTLISALGGARVVPQGSALPLPRCSFVLGDSGERVNTGILVARVAALRRFPSARKTLETIGDLTRRGARALRRGDLEGLGGRMEVNGLLLDSLGVGTPRLRAMADSALEAGALGAKLTGAGGGGCVVALALRPAVVARAVRRAGGTPMVVRPEARGLVVGR
ncbi:MAG: mevalonate kinase [Halobacteria archaeon]